MKKLFALLLTVVMMASMMVPAMAEGGEEGAPATTGYTAITPDNTNIKHSLQLTEPDADRLPYDITYSFSVGAPEVMNASTNGVTTAGNAVSGSPTIAPVTYSEEDFFNPDNKTCEKTLSVNWAGVTIKEPGVYRWTVSQTYATDAPQNPSNASATFYLFMYVEDNAGELTETFIMTKTPTVGEVKNGTLGETYPAKTLDLTLTKNVSGNQASKDQYFPFTLTLTAPQADAVNSSFNYQIVPTTEGSYDKEVPATAYHAATTNPDHIAVANGTTGTFTLWLKHGQSVTIKNLVYGSAYSITEGGNSGYTVDNVVTGDTKDVTDGGISASDSSMTADATVAYTNTKELETPTGISLQSGVAFFGLVMAMGMMVLMFVGKRKEQN